MQWIHAHTRIYTHIHAYTSIYKHTQAYKWQVHKLLVACTQAILEWHYLSSAYTRHFPVGVSNKQTWSLKRLWSDITQGMCIQDTCIHVYLYIKQVHSCHPKVSCIQATSHPCTLIAGNPPPRGDFLYTMFPNQEPEGRGPPSKNSYQVLRGGSSFSGFVLGNLVNRNPPP